MLTWAELIALYRLSYTQPPAPLTPRYNISPTQDALVCRVRRDGERELLHMRWGLIPFWAKDESLAARTINARVETVDQKPSFREAFKARRCLIPCNGWYEWRTEAGGKQPYLFRHAESETGALTLAGIWERWQREGREVISFSILVGDAHASIGSMHHRAPAILRQSQHADWLSVDTPKEHLLEMVRTPDPGPFLVTRVSRRVNSPKNDDSSLVDEIGESA